MDSDFEFHQLLRFHRSGHWLSRESRPAVFHGLSCAADGGFSPSCPPTWRAVASMATHSSSGEGGVSSMRPAASTRSMNAVSRRPATKSGMFQHAAEERDVRFDAENLVLAERPPHARDGFRAVSAPHGDFREQRVVFQGHRPSFVNAAVMPHAGSRGRLEPADAAGRGQKTVAGILRVDAALDAAPRMRTSCCRHASLSPAAILICSFTKSIPITSSVIACST